jgi:hypothetical protein
MKYNISIKDTTENPLNSPRRPPKCATKSMGPYNSFLSDETNSSDLKNIEKDDKCKLKGKV